MKLASNGADVDLGGLHGVCLIQKDKVNADLLAFIKAWASQSYSGARRKGMRQTQNVLTQGLERSL